MIADDCVLYTSNTLVVVIYSYLPLVSLNLTTVLVEVISAHKNIIETAIPQQD